MNILADTHILIWALLNDRKLPTPAKEHILSEKNRIFYSMISVWEVAMKHKAHADQMDFTGALFNSLCEKAGYIRLDGMIEHVLTLETLKIKAGKGMHKDPFDRLLIAQAKYENMKFMTHDGKMKNYDESCILPV